MEISLSASMLGIAFVLLRQRGKRRHSPAVVRLHLLTAQGPSLHFYTQTALQ
jgi:hypothetical protein